MASPSIASFFNVRKRAAADDIVNARNKVLRLDSPNETTDRAKALVERAILAKNKLVDADLSTSTFSTTSAKIVKENAPAQAKPSVRRTTRRTIKRTNATTATEEALKQPKIVKFTLGGSLSPRKKAISSQALLFKAIDKNLSGEAPTTPTKQPVIEPKPSTSTVKAGIVNKCLTNAKKELSFDEIKSKVGRSSRLDELKTILNKRQQLEEQYQACINKRNAKLKAQNSPLKADGQTLKQFDTIELEVLSRYVESISLFFRTRLKQFGHFNVLI